MNDRRVTRLIVALWIVFLTLLFLLVVYVTPTRAAPLAPQSICRAGEFQQHDMAGRYESQWMMLDVYPCGVTVIYWVNLYGEHTAAYYSENRLPGGGLATYGIRPDDKINAYLDGENTLFVKPAEPGWIQVATITNESLVRHIYRLQKTR